MDYPIPQDSVTAFNAHRNREPQNAGLIFERFAPDWQSDAKIKEKGLEAALIASQKADAKLLAAWNQRWESLARDAHAQMFTLQTDWRLIAGLGRKGSLEVGFTFHRYGFPYLLGSSLKGLARTAGLLGIGSELGKDALETVRTKVIQDDKPKEAEKIGLLSALELALSRAEEITFAAEMAVCNPSTKVMEMAKAFRAIFGTQDEAGKVLFFDAIPSAIALPDLEMDIMNPHYPDYYKETGDEHPKVAPTSWQSPNPVKFLTVAPGVQFRFALAWRRSPQDRKDESEFHQPAWSWFKGTSPASSDEDAPRLLRLARAWLESGLRDLGAGGKTNAGYGYFIEAGSGTPSDRLAIVKEKLALPTGYERGVVKDFGLGENRSYGFITRSNGEDLFVHRNNLSAGLTELKPRQKVVFKVGRGSRGPQAMDVRLEI